MNAPFHVLNWQYGWWLVTRRVRNRRDYRTVLSSRRLPGRLQLVPSPARSTRSHRAGRARDHERGVFAVAVACTRQLDGHGGIAVFRCGRHHHAGGMFPDRLATGFPPRVCGAGDIPRSRGRVHVPRGWSMKIGFLALSGIRAHDPELLALGLTLPGFVNRSKAIASLPSLGLLYLAACTPEGHESILRGGGDGNEPTDVYAAISWRSARSRHRCSRRTRSPTGCARRGSASPWAGCTSPSCRRKRLPQRTTSSSARGSTSGRPSSKRRRDEPPRIFRTAANSRPSMSRSCRCPATTCWASRPYNRFTVQTSRGCPWRCDFCASNVMLGQPYRKRPVEHVIRDIEAIMQVREPPVHRVRRRQHVRRQDVGQGTVPAARAARLNWFTETDISVADDRGAARPDARRPAAARF